MSDEKYLELVEEVWAGFLAAEEQQEIYISGDEFDKLIQVMYDFLQNVEEEE